MSELDSGNTAWMLFATALVFFMTPGVALYYGGMTRGKNVAGTMMQMFMAMAVVAVLWVTVGYTLAFGRDVGLGLLGGFDHFALRDVAVGVDRFAIHGPEQLEADQLLAHGVPDLLFMVFYMAYAIITPVLITGTFAERAKFGPFLLFVALWSLIVFAPVLHWVFGVNGWLNVFSGPGVHAHTGINGLDFAGGLAVHVNAGFAALAAVLVFGRRRGYGVTPMEPHSTVKIFLGSSMMWFCCFGFIAGSAVASDEQAIYAFVSAIVAAGAGSLSWMLASWWHGGKPRATAADAPPWRRAWGRLWRSGGHPSAIGASSGVTAGLVAVTPASGYVQPMEAIAIGLAAGAICYFAVRLRPRTGLDDSLDVIAVHGVAGVCGAIATGLFATSAVGAPEFREGLIAGEWRLLWDQTVGVLVVGGYSFTATFLILKGLDLAFGVRLSAEDEEMGLDLSQHGERAYVRREEDHADPGSLFPGGILVQPVAPLIPSVPTLPPRPSAPRSAAPPRQPPPIPPPPIPPPQGEGEGGP